MRSFAVLCIIATVAAVDTQAEYTASIGHIANKTDGHIAAEVNTLQDPADPNDCVVTNHFTGVAFTLKLGDSTEGYGNQWCNTATCITDPTDSTGTGANILDYKHPIDGDFDCGVDSFDKTDGATWNSDLCDVDGVTVVSCTWEDTIPGRLIAGVSDSPLLVATDTTHTQPAEKRMVTTIKPEARSLGGHQCALAQTASTINGITSEDCMCVCKA
jgi:hypothetical protein